MQVDGERSTHESRTVIKKRTPPFTQQCRDTHPPISLLSFSRPPHASTCTIPIPSLPAKLLEKGADPNVRAQATNSSALFTALLLKPENGGFPGGIASDPAIGPRVVRALVKAGADVNELSETMGLMPLHLACTDGACPEVIEALLDLGANASAPAMASGFLTPPYLATKVGHLQALRVLIERPGSGGVDAVTASPLYE